MSTHISQHTQSLEKLCQLLYKRDIKTAEQFFISFIEQVIDPSRKKDITTEDLMTLQVLYKKFNAYYFNWLEGQNFDLEREIDELTSEEHDNLLIGQFHDPGSVDDLLYETFKYLRHREEEEEQEVSYHLQCYKKYLNA